MRPARLAWIGECFRFARLMHDAPYVLSGLPAYRKITLTVVAQLPARQTHEGVSIDQPVRVSQSRPALACFFFGNRSLAGMGTNLLGAIIQNDRCRGHYAFDG